MTVNDLAEKFTACEKADVNVNIHAIGPDAIHNVLQAAGVVREAGHTNVRIICSHSSYVYAEDIELFGKYDVFSNTTGLWITAGGKSEDELIASMTKAKIYPVKSIMDSGAKVGFGSDFPTDPTTFSPIENIEALVTRTAITRHGGVGGAPADTFVHNPEECLSVEDVIRGYTINNAYQMGKEGVLGSIEPGKYADLTVFDKDIFTIDPHEIHTAHVCQTVKDGITTYRS